MDTEVQDELVEFPPHWWLKSKFMDSGMRRPKLVLLEKKRHGRYIPLGPAVSRALPEHYTRVYGFAGFNRIQPCDRPTEHNWKQRYTPTSSLVRAVAIADLRRMGNLDWNDYAFWAGEASSRTTFAMCRYCLHTSYGGPAARNYHKKFGLKEPHRDESCARRLQLVYKRQAKTKLCCVCLKDMVLHMWGLPFCSADCMKKFMFTTSSTQAHGPLTCWLPPVWDRVAMRAADSRSENEDPIL